MKTFEAVTFRDLEREITTLKFVTSIHNNSGFSVPKILRCEFKALTPTAVCFMYKFQRTTSLHYFFGVPPGKYKAQSKSVGHKMGLRAGWG